MQEKRCAEWINREVEEQRHAEALRCNRNLELPRLWDVTVTLSCYDSDLIDIACRVVYRWGFYLLFICHCCPKRFVKLDAYVFIYEGKQLTALAVSIFLSELVWLMLSETLSACFGYFKNKSSEMGTHRCTVWIEKFEDAFCYPQLHTVRTPKHIQIYSWIWFPIFTWQALFSDGTHGVGSLKFWRLNHSESYCSKPRVELEITRNQTNIVDSLLISNYLFFFLILESLIWQR